MAIMTQADNETIFTDNEYEIKLLLRKQKFQNGISELREKWHIPPSGFADNQSNNVWQEEINDNGLLEYKEDIYHFMRNLDLAERWYQGISYYMQNNLPGMLRVQLANPISFTYDGAALDRKNVRSVSIQMDKDTTQKELLEQFAEAKEILGVSKQKKQKPKRIDRDLLILEMHESGMRNADIAERLNNDQEIQESFNTDDVKTILKRMKHRLE
jgi:hypothetical protein